MKKMREVVVLGCILFSVSLLAQEMPKTQKVEKKGGPETAPVQKNGVPKLVLEKKEHNFGKIDKTSKANTVIKFRNEGTAVLEIKDVKTYVLENARDYDKNKDRHYDVISAFIKSMNCFAS